MVDTDWPALLENADKRSKMLVLREFRQGVTESRQGLRLRRRRPGFPPPGAVAQLGER